MGLQVIPQLGDMGTQLGQGMAQGLSEQLPKEVERYRLSQNLKELGPDYEKIAKASKFLPPEVIGPSVTRLLERDRLIGALGGNQNSLKQPTQGDSSSNNAPEGNWRDREAKKFLMSGAASDLQSAYALANDRNSTAEGAVQSLRNRINTVLQTNQDAQTYQSLPGEYLQQMENNVLDRVRSGQDEQTVLKEWEDKVNNLSKISSPLRKKVGFLNKAINTDSSYRSLNKSVDELKKLGMPEMAVNLLANNQGLSRNNAKNWVYGLSEPESEYIKSLRYGKAPQGVDFLQQYVKKTKSSDSEIAGQILDRLTPQDSIGSIAFELRKKGYDSENILNKIQELVEKRGVVLSDRQNQEISFTPTATDILGDLFGMQFFNKRLSRKR
jgi:hypothetical protein